MDASVSVKDKITLLMYLPEVGWTTLICIPRAKLGELCLTPVKWLRYFASNVYGADGGVYSRGYTDEDAEEDEIMTDEDADKEEVMTNVQSEEEEEEPAVVKNHGESKEEPASPKVPVDQTTILISAQLEEIPAICYFWSKCEYAPRLLDLEMTADRTSDAGSLNREYLLPSKVKERDRHNCVFHAGVSIQVSHITVEVCHLVPHSKGNEYVERLKRYHEVPLEDQMRVFNTSLNAICMKDSWHKYVDRSLVAILPVPNRFLSKEDINFTAKPRFNVPDQPYASMLRPEDESHGDGQSEPSSTHLRFSYSEDDYQLPEQTLFERARKNDEKASAEVKWKQENGKEAVNAAELITAPGYPKFKKPREEPFNDESQLVLQYFITGPMGVGEGDVRTVPHNTPALLRSGTRLSVTALHAAYTSAVWKMFSPLTTGPRFDHYGLQQTQQNTSGHMRTAPTSTSTSTSHSRRIAGQQQQRTNNVGTFSSVGRPHP